MNYYEIEPPADISSFVKCFWKYENMDEDIQHTIFPNGCFELFMIFYRQSLVTVFLSGIRTEPFEVEVPKDVTVSAVRFKLSAYEYVFNREICSLLNTTLSLDLNYWNLKDSEHLSFEERALNLSHKISEIVTGKEIDPEKMFLLETIYTPDLNVKDVSIITKWDRRRINRYFNNQFGISLKTFLNIIRLRSSFEAIKRGNLYPDLNYYDQSHYIKEIKKYTGKSPKELSKNEDDRFLQLSVKKES